MKQKGVLVYSKYEDVKDIVIFRMSSHIYKNISQDTKNRILGDAVDYARKNIRCFDRIDGATWVNVGR